MQILIHLRRIQLQPIGFFQKRPLVFSVGTVFVVHENTHKFHFALVFPVIDQIGILKENVVLKEDEIEGIFLLSQKSQKESDFAQRGNVHRGVMRAEKPKSPVVIEDQASRQAFGAGGFERLDIVEKE